MKFSLVWIALVLILMLTPELLAQLGPDVSSGPVQHRSEGNHPASEPRSGFATVAPVEIAPPVLMHVSAGDLLDFSIFGVPDLTQRVRVNNAGNVYLPLIDYVHLDTLSVEAAQAVIEKKYVDGGFLRNPHVTIAIVESTSGVLVHGEVAKPGIYPVLGAGRLFDLLATAGGVTPTAGGVVTITHHDDPDHPETVMLSNNPKRSTQGDVPVYQGDIIDVSKAGIVYVVGEVVSPSGFVMEQQTSMMLTKAIAMAHGPNGSAKLNNTDILRRTSNGQQQLIRVQLGKILSAKAPDVPLQADDIVYVPSSKAKAVVRTVASMAQTVAIVGVTRAPW